MQFSSAQAILEQNEITLSKVQIEKFLAWKRLLLAMNQKHNLISRKNTEQFWELHLLHSLSILSLVDFPHRTQICDFGTGGGIPGIPLAIVRPDLQITLLDSKQKKIHSVQKIVHNLQITNVTCFAGRGEEIQSSSPHFKKYTFILAKSVTSLLRLEQWTRTLRTKNSCIYAYKGGDLTQEKKAILNHPHLQSYREQSLQLKGFARFAEQEKKIVTLQLLR